MEELIGSDVWREASDEHRRFLKSQIREKAFKLLMDAGFPPDAVRRVQGGTMNGWLSPENMAQLMLLCALLFTIVCSLLAFAGVVYLGGRLAFSLLGEVEKYRYRRASVRIREAEAARAEMTERNQ